MYLDSDTSMTIFHKYKEVESYLEGLGKCRSENFRL